MKDSTKSGKIDRNIVSNLLMNSLKSSVVEDWLWSILEISAIEPVLTIFNKLLRSVSCLEIYSEQILNNKPIYSSLIWLNSLISSFIRVRFSVISCRRWFCSANDCFTLSSLRFFWRRTKKAIISVITRMDKTKRKNNTLSLSAFTRLSLAALIIGRYSAISTIR